jgi:1-acyl-sn-glycerol-3-phosphate acyltransferase
MKTVLGYLLTPIFYLCFVLVLVIFDPIQRISLNVLGHNAHDRVVSSINFWLMASARVLGASFTIEGNRDLPTDRPLIITANHQSMYDIPPIFWYFRKHHPKFVVKKELGKGIPTISYNIRRGGSVMIDRKNPRQAVPEIHKLGALVQQHNFAAVIYPEGTRSRSGAMKPFKAAGLEALLQSSPDALLVPLTINHTYKFTEKGLFPLAIGVRASYYVHDPLENKGDHTALIAAAEEAVRSKLKA